MNHTTIPNYVAIISPEIEWEPPKRNVLPDELEEAELEEEWGCEVELNFDGEV
jgi:hypothetical protein